MQFAAVIKGLTKLLYLFIVSIALTHNSSCTLPSIKLFIGLAIKPKEKFTESINILFSKTSIPKVLPVNLPNKTIILVLLYH